MASQIAVIPEFTSNSINLLDISSILRYSLYSPIIMRWAAFEAETPSGQDANSQDVKKALTPRVVYVILALLVGN